MDRNENFLINSKKIIWKSFGSGGGDGNGDTFDYLNGFLTYNISAWQFDFLWNIF